MIHLNNTQLTAYFAAHAPTDVPSWFQFPFRDRPQLPSPSELPENLRDQWHAYNDGGIDESQLHTEVKLFAQRRDIAWAQREKFDRELEEAKFIAWRWHYARLMQRSYEARAIGEKSEQLHREDLNAITLYEIWRGSTFERYSLTPPDATGLFIRPVDKDEPGASLIVYAFSDQETAAQFVDKLDYIEHSHSDTHTFGPNLTCILFELNHGDKSLRIIDLRAHDAADAERY